MNFRPGYGTQRIHLRETTAQVEKSLGSPAIKKSSGKLREYWLYPNDFFECIVSNRSNRVLSLFFHPGSGLLDAEIFQLSEPQILRAYGHPMRQGGGVTLSTGAFVPRWLSYPTGLGFSFDERGSVATVSIFAASAKAKGEVQKVAACTSVPQQLAALRI